MDPTPGSKWTTCILGRYNINLVRVSYNDMFPINPLPGNAPEIDWLTASAIPPTKYGNEGTVDTLASRLLDLCGFTVQPAYSQLQPDITFTMAHGTHMAARPDLALKLQGSGGSSPIIMVVESKRRDIGRGNSFRNILAQMVAEAIAATSYNMANRFHHGKVGASLPFLYIYIYPKQPIFGVAMVGPAPIFCSIVITHQLLAAVASPHATSGLHRTEMLYYIPEVPGYHMDLYLQQGLLDDVAKEVILKVFVAYMRKVRLAHSISDNNLHQGL